MNRKPEIKQVFSLKPSVDMMSKTELLFWVNDMLKTTFNEVNELCTGAAFCQLMHMLFPYHVPFERVKLFTDVESDCIHNYKVLGVCFEELGVQKKFNIANLVKGNYRDNLELLQWFKKFFDANSSGRPYDPIEIRHGIELGYGRRPQKVRVHNVEERLF